MANRYVTGVVCMALLVGLLMAEEPEGKVCTDKCKVCKEADAVAFAEKYGTGLGLGGCKQKCTDEGASIFACGAAAGGSFGGAYIIKKWCCPCGPEADLPQDCNDVCKKCQDDHGDAFATVYDTGMGLGGCQEECVHDPPSFACGGVRMKCCPCDNDNNDEFYDH